MTNYFNSLHRNWKVTIRNLYLCKHFQIHFRQECYLYYLLLYMFVGGGGILAYFELSPPIYALLSFSQVPVMAVCIVSMLWAIGRGNVWGLIVILYFYLSGLLLTVVSFILLFTIYFESSGGVKKLELIPVQLIVIFIARDIMNGEALFRLVSYYQLRRIAQEAYKIRNKLTDRHKKK